MRGRILRNPLVLLGAGILLIIGATGLVVDISPMTYVAQSTLPVLVGGISLVYGWHIRGEMIQSFRRTIYTWIGYGLFSFFVVGFWFGFLSRQFDTSFGLAVVASLSIGATFGALVGLYAARLQQTNTELAAQKDRLEEFSGIVSHDLQNPLHVAQGYLELAQNDCESAHLDTVENAHEQMETLIDDLLTLARQGATINEPEHVALGTLAETCWQTVETADATLVMEADQTIRADSSRVQQLLENLIRNAIEHGGENVTVTIGDLDDGFYVVDDGAGIPDHEYEQVFKPGYSTEDDGTGFGLNIVKKIADAHGWSIRVTDSETGGSRFEITGVDIVD